MTYDRTRLGRARTALPPASLIFSLALALAPTFPAAQTAGSADQRDSDQGGDGDAPQSPPTFQEVLNNPSDTALVFRYARHKIEQGELPAAASALDQILIQKPNLHSVRLIYGIVLYRLGDLSGARAELQRVDAQGLPAALQAKRSRYLDKIARDKQTVLGELTLSAGLSYETNASSAPESGQAVVFDIPFTVHGEEDDVAYTGNAKLRLEHDLETSVPVTLFTEVRGYAREQVEVDSQDLRFGSIKAGTRVRTLSLDVIPSVSAGIVTLSNERFYRFAGPNLRVELPVDGKATIFAEGSWYAESFDPIAESRTADDRSGQRAEGRVGIKATPTPPLLVKSYLQVTEKRAREDFEAFTGTRLAAEGTLRVFDDHFVQLSGLVGLRDYDDNDPFISATARNDRFMRVRLGYGLPVPGAGQVAEELDDLMIVPSVTYYKQDSNIRNFEYENVTTSLMLTKTVDF